MPVIISDALPIQFWPIGADTFNESMFGFVDKRCFYQEFASGDTIKLQVADTVLSNNYYLTIHDKDGKFISYLTFTKTTASGYNVFDLEFNFSSLFINDSYVRVYIVQNLSGTLDDLTFDSATLDTTDFITNRVYKSDLIKISSAIPLNQSWGTKVLNYKSARNFAGIYYPNNSNFFSLRIPCRFFHERNASEQNSINLSNSKVINTSTFQKRQQYLETWYMPDYLLNKIELILAHAVTGQLQIDSVNWTIDETFERANADARFAFQRGNVWLSRQNYTVRNVI